MTSPDQPSSLQALERERERAVALLSRSFAADHLSMDELETRLELAYRAASVAEVRALVSDIEDPAAPGGLPMRPAPSPAQSVRSRMLSLLGTRVRRGVWVPPQRLELLAIMSDTHLDLREAQLTAGVTEIEVKATMAAVKITVPPGVHVVTDTTAIMASVSDRTTRGPVPPAGAPVVRVTGWAVMADVVVRRKDLSD